MTALAGALLGSGVTAGALAAEPTVAVRLVEVASSAAAAAGSGQSYAPVVKLVTPSVVLIRTADGLGSGVVLDDKGNIVTNAHVAARATVFQIQVGGDRAVRSAHLVGSDSKGDLAVIRADDPAGLKPARFGDSGSVRVGEWCLPQAIRSGSRAASPRALCRPPGGLSPGRPPMSRLALRCQASFRPARPSTRATAAAR